MPPSLEGGSDAREVLVTGEVVQVFTDWAEVGEVPPQIIDVALDVRRRHSWTELRSFEDHFSPSRGHQYFQRELPALANPDAYWVNVVVTAYNEIAEDLVDTLDSLEAQAKNLGPGNDMHVLLVFDGWWKVSPCMKRVLRQLFTGSQSEWEAVLEGKDERPSWMAELDERRSDGVETFTLQEVGAGGQLEPLDLGGGRRLHVSAVIKLDNRRKHNSHEWYLRAFAPCYPARYLFFTDVGTTADQHCIPRLAAYMDANPDYVATTGFQRVASRPGVSFVQQLHAEIQSYELGPGMCSTIKAAQACIGFQMILCGPCTMVRASGATEEVLDAFFDMMNRDPTTGGVMLANLQLTEDMAFGCYLYALNDRTTGKTGYVPDAYFNYDVETIPDRYLKQRRRWMNGIVAGMNHLLFRLFVRHLRRPLLDKLLLGAVFIFQYHFAMQFLVLPGFYMCAAYSMLGGFHTPPPEALFYVHSLEPVLDWVPLAGAIGLWLFLAVWVVVHHRTVYVGWLYHAVLALVMVGGGLLGGGGMVVWRISPEGSLLHDKTGDGFSPLGLAVSVGGLLAALVPILSAVVLADLRGLRVSLLNSFLQLWFMPMYCLTGAYSMARFSDLTWGNRPHQSSGTDGALRDVCMKRCRRAGQAVAAAYLVANAAVGGGLILLGHYRPWGIDPFVVAACAIVFPVSISSVCGLSFTCRYALLHRWIPALRSAFAASPDEPPSSPSTSTSPSSVSPRGRSPSSLWAPSSSTTSGAASPNSDGARAPLLRNEVM